MEEKTSVKRNVFIGVVVTAALIGFAFYSQHINPFTKFISSKPSLPLSERSAEERLGILKENLGFKERGGRSFSIETGYTGLPDELKALVDFSSVSELQVEGTQEVGKDGDYQIHYTSTKEISQEINFITQGTADLSTRKAGYNEKAGFIFFSTASYSVAAEIVKAGGIEVKVKITALKK